MKKQTILSTLVLASGVLGLASCGGNTSSNTAASTAENTEASVKGSYSYASYGNTYGMAVDVKYDTKTKKITSVTRDAAAITAGNFVEVTQTVLPNWDGAAMSAAYTAAIDAQLKEYEGADYTALYNKIKEGVIIQYTNEGHTTLNVDATPTLKADQQFIIIAGATQTAVRTAVAIANAIANIDAGDALTPLETAAYVAPSA